MDEMTYYHVELGQHDVILAEGLPCESYLDAGDRSNFENGGKAMRLFADFSRPSRDTATLWEAKSCAPLVVHGPRLEAARAVVNAQSMTMANAVMRTGRKRVKPACSAAVTGSLPCAICSRAKLTTRMLFAVATPMHMIAPINAGTLSVVFVMKSIQTIPASAAGNAEIMMNGSSHDWKFTTISR